MPQSRSLALCVLTGALVCTMAAAQTAAPNVRITTPIDESQLVTLKGNVNPNANAKNDRGPVSPSLALPDLTLVLSRSPERQSAFDAFVASQYDPGSPDFHHWLTPQEIGERFGPSEADITTICSWLTSQGFTIKRIPPGRMTIRFSGTAGMAESAFHTEIHNLSVHGVPHFANMTAPQIPAALAPVVVGVKSLDNFLPRPLHVLGSKVKFNPALGGWQRIESNTSTSSTGAGARLPLAGLAATGKPALNVSGPRPEFGINGGSGSSAYLEEDVTPYDFATIYNVLPLWNAGTPINGAGQTIAIDGTSKICLGDSGSPCNGNNDVATYRKAFGLPAYTSANAPKEIDTGDGPAATICSGTTAICNSSDLLENTLDVEVSGGVAPGAQIDLVVTGQNSTGTVDTVFDSAQYVVDNKIANILSLSYGMCELGNGTAENVAYYDLWQQAAAEGIAVFVASGDSGSPACDQGQDAGGIPYSAQLGLAVNGLASTPFNVAVGGTDFSWCQPYYDSSGNFKGCPTSSSTQGSPAYWNTSNDTTTGASAAGYVPETPWNDSCLNPIWTKYLNSAAPLLGYTAPTSAEGACNFVQNNWLAIYQTYLAQYGQQFVLAPFVDTVGGGGGTSNCVVNSGTTSTTFGTCTSNSTTTGTANGSIPLTNDGWPSPTWQAQSGVTGTSSLTQRALPDVSFFSGDGSLDSATLICASVAGACVTSVSANETTEPSAQEVGGTSVASPEMAGVMALINQKWNSPQGNPNPVLYQLAAKQTYSSCSAESVKNSSSCYFQSIDTGTIAMPCSLGAANGEGGITYSSGGWTLSTPYTGAVSPNCTAINNGDTIGTLVSSGTTPGFNATAGFNMATGLGSLNVANVVNATGVWAMVGTTASTLTVTPASNSISTSQSLNVTVTVSGASGTPTGTVTLAGNGYASSSETLTSGSYTFTIPAGSLTGSGNTFTATLTATYSGDPTYARATGTANVTVTKLSSTVTVTPGSSSINSNDDLPVTVSVSGSGSTPTGTVTLSGGGYTSAAETLSSGSYTFTIPANTFTGTAGTTASVTLAANYNGDTTYASGSGSGAVNVTYVSVVAPTITFNPSSPAVYTGQQNLSLTVSVGGSAGAAVGTVTLAGGAYSSGAQTLSSGSYTFSIPVSALSVGNNALTATYVATSGSNYYGDHATVTVKVTQSTYVLTAGTVSPSSVSAGGTATVTISGSTSSADNTDYSGTVALSSCTLTNYPSGATSLPSCTASGTITYTSGTPSGSGTATVTTTATTTSAVVYPKAGRGKGLGGRGLTGVGGGATLALLVFLGIPSRRRKWRSMLGLVVLLAALGGLSACGGGGGGGGKTTIPGTSAGTYSFTVVSTANPAVTPAPQVSFQVTVQ